MSAAVSALEWLTCRAQCYQFMIEEDKVEYLIETEGEYVWQLSVTGRMKYYCKAKGRSCTL